MIFTPRSAAYARSAAHSRSKRTWSAIAPRGPKRAQSSIHACSRSRKSSSSAFDTGAAGSPSRPGQAANAEAAL